jgi:hypothetical protein
MAVRQPRIRTEDESQRRQKQDEERRQALARCDRSSERIASDESRNLPGEAEEEPPCRCVRVDVDLDDERDCPLHGPGSVSARQVREQEAAELAAYYAHDPFATEPRVKTSPDKGRSHCPKPWIPR